MIAEPHTDTLTNQQQVRSITHGGTQAADSAAMEAMWQALDMGVGKEEAETIFSNTYQQIICASKRTNAAS